MTAFMCLVLAGGVAGRWVWKRLQVRRARIDAERVDTAALVDEAFADFQESIAEILDRDPQRRDELVRDLEAATAVWEQAEFNGVVKPLRRDREFRRSIKAAHRAANNQT